MYGLVDYDLQTSTSVKLSYPNLEIMKLATYYKVEENIYCKLVSLDETNLDGYDKIFFFSEKDAIPQNIPPPFLKYKNIIFGGTAFTNGVYIPFENEIIDFTLPKASIYKEFLKQKYNDGVKAKIINHILDDSYYRHFAGEKELPLPVIRKKKRFFLYDKNFFSNDWQRICQEVKDRGASSIYTIHPIICHTLTDYFAVRSESIIAKSNDIILDLNIPLEEVPYMLKKYKNLFLADILKNSNIFLTLGGTYKSSFIYYKDLIYKLNLLYSFWSQKIPIKIMYLEPEIGIKDILAPLSKFIAVWSSNLENKKTINERITYKDKKHQSLAAEAKDILLKFHPSAKDLFEQTFIKLSERGYWRI